MDKQGKIDIGDFKVIASLLIVFVIYFLFVSIVFAVEPSISLRIPAPSSLSRDSDVNFSSIISWENETYLVNLTSNWDEYPNFTVNFSNIEATNNSAWNATLSGLVLNIPNTPAELSGWEWYLIIDQQNDTNLTALSNNESQTSTFTLFVDNSTPTITTDTFVNNTLFKSGTAQINATVIDTNPSKLEFLIFNITSLGAETQLESHNLTYENDTLQEIVLDLPDGTYLVQFGASDKVEPDTLYYNETNKTFVIDGNNPSISISGPLNNSYLNDSIVTMTYIPTDSLLDSCSIYLSNETGNSFAGDATEALISNTTNISSTGLTSGLEVNNTITFAESPSGQRFIWSVTCNDTVNNVIWSDNQTFIIDTTYPGDANQTFPVNDSITPDFTTNLTWDAVAETNFDVYNIRVYGAENRDNIIVDVNLTGNNTLNHNLTFGDIPFNESTYFWEVISLDLAGNMLESADLFNFTTETHCANLSEGWNLCGFRRNGLWNLSQVAEEANADRVAILNDSKDFQTFAGGFTTNADIQVTYRDLLLIHINTTTQSALWENDYFLANQNATDEQFINLTNTTNGYNAIVVGNMSGLTMQQLEDLFYVQGWGLNGTVEFTWFYDNDVILNQSGNVFVNHKDQWNQSDSTVIGWLEPLYLYINITQETIALNFSCEPTVVYANNLNASDCGTG